LSRLLVFEPFPVREAYKSNRSQNGFAMHLHMSVLTAKPVIGPNVAVGISHVGRLQPAIYINIILKSFLRPFSTKIGVKTPK
jgi:hypothetical protein